MVTDGHFNVLTDVEDYNGARITVDVPAGVSTQSFTINIIDNNVVECDEVFSVTIESVTTCGVTTGDVVSSNVTIMDDDGEGRVYLQKKRCMQFKVHTSQTNSVATLGSLIADKYIHHVNVTP